MIPVLLLLLGLPRLSPLRNRSWEALGGKPRLFRKPPPRQLIDVDVPGSLVLFLPLLLLEMLELGLCLLLALVPPVRELWETLANRFWLWGRSWLWD